MKKIKYGNKRYEPDNRQIQNLKQGDEICGAMLDTFSDDYLSYITNLMKNTKTPNKNAPQKQNNFLDSDEQSPPKFEKQLEMNTLKPFLHPQSKPRRHSQSSAKGSTFADNKEYQFHKHGKVKNQSTKVSPSSRIKQMKQNQKLGGKMKKRKVQYIYNQPILKNQQKTMHFSRNTMQHSKYNDERIEFNKQIHGKSRVTSKSREKYITAQNYDDTDHDSPSIEIPFRRQMKNRKPNQENFIDNINHYISSLQLNQSISKHHQKKDEQEQRQKLMKKFNKVKKSKCDEEQYDIYEIFKQNLKLNKKVKKYQEKISDLDEQISNHLNQWKSKQKAYKGKIQHLLKGLVQAFMKIDGLQGQVNSLKDLHRSYGQKVKQLQTKYEDDDTLEEIRQQLFKSFAPKKHSSQLRTKHKKALQSTLPKYEQDRRGW